MWEGIAYREEPAEELCSAGEGCLIAFILRQAAAQETQPVLPHLDGQGASCGEELGAPIALHVSYSQRLHGRRLWTGVAQWVKDKEHAYPSEQQDNPAVVTIK